MMFAASTEKNRARPATAPPERFMYERGFPRITRRPARRPSTISGTTLLVYVELSAHAPGKGAGDHEADVVPGLLVLGGRDYPGR